MKAEINIFQNKKTLDDEASENAFPENISSEMVRSLSYHQKLDVTQLRKWKIKGPSTTRWITSSALS